MHTVAQAVGVATSTVSKALRSDPTIPEARRIEIRRMADRLGYRPDPMVAALMARLHTQRRRNDPHHIAWIDLWPDHEEAARTTDFKLMLRGANERANELGYQIEVHRVGVDQTSPARLRQILVSRSQWGLIIPPVPRHAMNFPLDVSGLSGVTIGTSLHSPTMHRVAADLYQGSQLACRKLRERGYRRIGLVLSRSMVERVERKWLAAYLAEQIHWPAGERVPPLIVDAHETADFTYWQNECRPDAILVAELHVEEWVATQPSGSRPTTVWLRRIEKMRRNGMAIDTRPAKMGAAAVELVVGQIHRNERGSPEIPHTLLLESIWTGS